MQTYALGSTAELTGASRQSAVDRMSSGDFFKLLVVELQQQDPFEPTKTADMIGQVSQIRGIEQSQQLMDVLEQLTSQQRTAGASELLGRFVEAEIVAADGTRSMIAGVVTGVRFGADGVAVLELDTGGTVRASDVTRVMTVEQAELGSAAGEKSEAGA